MDRATQSLRDRISGAQRLGEAIAECDPRDAVLILAAALDDLTGDVPAPAFLDAEREAAFWAEGATQIELEACFTACIARLAENPATTNAKKRLFVSLWETFGADDRDAFLTRVQAQPVCYGKEKSKRAVA